MKTISSHLKPSSVEKMFDGKRNLKMFLKWNIVPAVRA